MAIAFSLDNAIGKFPELEKPLVHINDRQSIHVDVATQVLTNVPRGSSTGRLIERNASSVPVFL